MWGYCIQKQAGVDASVYLITLTHIPDTSHAGFEVMQMKPYFVLSTQLC